MSDERHETVEQPVTNCNALNAAKMRQALANIVLTTIKAGKSISCDVACGIISSTAKAALSAKPRNCDMHTTLDDARNAFFADYVSDETCSSATAFAIWLYDEAKGVTDGSK